MADPLSAVERIVKVAFMIKEAVDKVRKNKDECREIRKRVLRVSALLTRLQETEMMKDPAMGSALKELEQTLTVAHDLVTSCQRKNILSHFFSAGGLAKQLREVNQDISDLMVDGIFATNISATIILTNIQIATCSPPQEDAGMVNIHSSHTTDSYRSELMDSEKNVPAGSKPSAIQFPGLTTFTLQELEVATRGFSNKRIVGDGASAVVYKGVLHDGQVVAIKKFRDSVGFSEAYFYDELNLVTKLQHISVAKLVGYCHEVKVSLQQSGEKYIGVPERHCFFVEEYMPNGSLETIIIGSQCGWCHRFEIINRIANSLCYLHEKCIVHSDLKPSNILLDHNMNPKINDFVIARTLDHGDDLTAHDVNYLAGTMGYMPPEYIVEGILSMKYDVYSFGIILLETIGCMCEYGNFRRQAAVEWAWEVRNAGFTVELFDPSLCDVTEHEQIWECIGVGLMCTQLKPADRPTMADVREMLNGRRELQIPKKARYIKQRGLPSKVNGSRLPVIISSARLSKSCG